MTYQEWLKNAIIALSQYQTAKLDAYLLLSYVTKRDRAALLAFDDTQLSEQEISQLTALLQRRCTGEPMAYILGEKEFWSMPLKVSEHTLIPRPDTEILVEQALTIARAEIVQFNPKQYKILDLGTGTGAIALALAKELQEIAKQHGCELTIIGVDQNADIIALANQNKQLNHLEFVQFQVSHWFSNIAPEADFNLIVSNPPYIADNDPHLQQGDVRFEPRTALVAAQQGFADIYHIIEQAPDYLISGGWLLFEHGWQQAQQIRHYFEQQHWLAIQTNVDYAQHERITFAQYSQNGENQPHKSIK